MKITDYRLSEWGQLRHKLDNLGIDGAPIITDAELRILEELTKELQNVMIDIAAQPLVEYFGRYLETVKRVREHRLHYNIVI